MCECVCSFCAVGGTCRRLRSEYATTVRQFVPLRGNKQFRPPEQTRPSDTPARPCFARNRPTSRHPGPVFPARPAAARLPPFRPSARPGRSVRRDYFRPPCSCPPPPSALPVALASAHARSAQEEFWGDIAWRAGRTKNEGLTQLVSGRTKMRVGHPCFRHPYRGGCTPYLVGRAVFCM